MKPLGTIFELPDVLDSIGLEDPISMYFSIFPLSDVFNPIPFFLLGYLQIFVLAGILFRDLLVRILGQPQWVIKIVVELLSFCFYRIWQSLIIVVNLYFLFYFEWPFSLMKFFSIELPLATSHYLLADLTFNSRSAAGFPKNATPVLFCFHGIAIDHAESNLSGVGPDRFMLGTDGAGPNDLTFTLALATALVFFDLPVGEFGHIVELVLAGAHLPY